MASGVPRRSSLRASGPEKMKPAHLQPAASQNEVRRHDQHAARLGNAGRDGRAHKSLLQREHEQPVEKNIDHRRDRRAHAHEHRRAVVAAVVIHERHQPRRHGKERVPEQIVTHELMVGLVRAEQRCNLGRQARADERHDERGCQRTGKRVHERLIRAGNVPRPMRTAETVTPPTTVSMMMALSTITNGQTRLTAPSASVPTP